MAAEETHEYDISAPDGAIAQIPPDELARLIFDLERQMKDAAKMLEFEKAALLRDQIVQLRRIQEVV
jgi:excinuclease ABC subunit B